MDGESKQLIGDCFLRPIADARSTNASIEPAPSKVPLKTELQVLRLSEEGQAAVLDTLRYIHGQDYQLADKSSYVDKGTRYKNGYWQERGNLVVQGGCDYSNIQKSGCDSIDRYRMFAILKLESYGFHKSHCIEALDCCKGDVEEALILLFSKYFPSYVRLEKPAIDYEENEILELRNDEISALESIYDSAFEVKEQNKVWQLKLKIDHLLVHSPSEQRKKVVAKKEKEKEQRLGKSKLEKCKNLMKGHCKYGDRCRYSHKIDSDCNDKPLDPTLDPNWFYLEIRFPAGNIYPYEPPLVFLKTTCPDIPNSLCLRLTRRIAEEANRFAEDQIPSVYTISELLQMDEEISLFLKSDRYELLDGKRSLFYVSIDDEIRLSDCKDLPTHYAKGSTRNSDKSSYSSAQMLKDDLNLVTKFMSKQNQKNYQDMLRTRKQLPAWHMMSNILEAIEMSPVVVISGETGCGKSTQIPQFILDDWLLKLANSNNKATNHVEIICTQPRRISAIGVAERVADERVEKIGNTVGYQIRLENKISSSTRLTFCTTGILLRRLQSDPLLESVSHIIVDEVHERSEESDFLLLILKELLVKRPKLKVILMSATLNAILFSDYFKDAPVMEIPGRTFPVEQIFLEDILGRCNFVLEADSQVNPFYSQYCRKLKKNEEQQLINELEFSDVIAANCAPPKSIRDENLSMADLFARYSDCSKATCKTLFLMDPLRINPELIESILQYIVDGDHKWPRVGSIVIFLPGLAEIQTIHDALSDNATFSPRTGKYVLVPLHSTLTNEEQALVFKPAPQGKRKIVLSTNIAETSVTIDDCVFVVDCGQMKEKRFDANRNMESLDLVWVSRANANQRKGRAGRVMPGVAIHLFTKHRFTNHFSSQPVPEIHRVPLEQLLLRIKTLPNFQSRNVNSVIANTLEPPSEEAISSAVKRLQDVGAFDSNDNLTPLGHHLAALPVDVRIGKLMLLGAIFQCVDSVLTIAACLSYKSPFVSPFSKRNEADSKKKEFAMCNSDHLTVLKAYRAWLEASKKSKYAGKCYAEQSYLSIKTLETLVEIKQQFLELLVSIGFVPADIGRRRQRFKDNVSELTGSEMNVNGENNRLLSALLCAALYPNVVKVLTPEKSFVMSAAGAVPRQPLPSELRFKTSQDGYVFIHPSSVNSVVGHFPSPFLVFQEKVKTSKIFIRECTMVPILPLVLFSGSNIDIELHGGEFILLLRGGWIMLQASSHAVAEMVKCLRLELATLLEEKIRDPCLNLLHHDNGKKIISTIVYLISKE
ncbi:putative ATP-dependent RNA helicase DHX57 [Pseudolycoriella hygida]|uniref:RNA helicase n=1 Tax=Pseudolycoriella hygida TaxID=35572 RepID=A0A9Q0MN58_9DIPT|nr:putative ATP-dependent RNA helicase DHX57 [Pseudolycoriella hygida]